MTRVTIALCLASLIVLFVAAAKGIAAAHGSVGLMNHVYWATGALTFVALSIFIAVAHLARAERMIRELRSLCAQNGIDYGED